MSVQVNLSVDHLIEIEAGNIGINQEDTRKIVQFLKVENDFDIFLEKIEETFNPGLKKSRIEMASTLSQLGLRFSDPSKYEQMPKGRVLKFSKRIEKPQI